MSVLPATRQASMEVFEAAERMNTLKNKLHGHIHTPYRDAVVNALGLCEMVLGLHAERRQRFTFLDKQNGRILFSAVRTASIVKVDDAFERQQQKYIIGCCREVLDIAQPFLWEE